MGGEGRVGREGKGCDSKGKEKMRSRWRPWRDGWGEKGEGMKSRCLLAAVTIYRALAVGWTSCQATYTTPSNPGPPVVLSCLFYK